MTSSLIKCQVLVLLRVQKNATAGFIHCNKFGPKNGTKRSGTGFFLKTFPVDFKASMNF